MKTRRLNYINPFFGYAILGISILISTGFFSYIFLGNARSLHIGLLLIYIILILGSKKKYNDSFLEISIKLTIFTILLSIIPAAIDYGQSAFETLLPCLNLIYGLFLFFVLKRYSFPTNIIIKVVVIFSVVWVLIELVQQITYPNFLFSGRFLSHGFVQERFGLRRFYIDGIDFVMISFSFFLGIAGKNNQLKKYSLLLVTFFLIGILCYLSRKHIYAALFALFLFIIWEGLEKRNYIGLLIVPTLIFLLYSNYFSQLQEVNVQSADFEGEGEDWIRFLSAKYYLFDFSKSNLYPFMGSGLSVEGSKLYSKLQYAQNFFGDMHGYWQSDVGIIGYYSRFGLFGVTAILMFILYFLYNWRNIDTWLKYFFSMKMVLIIFDFWGMTGVGMTSYAIFLYLTDNNIQRNKLKKQLKREALQICVT